MHALYSRVQPLDDDADAKKILTVSPLDLEFSLKISKYRNNETVADDRRWNFKRARLTKEISDPVKELVLQ